MLIAVALVLALTAGAIATMRGPHRAAGWHPRQVVLITIDTLRADRLGLYGYRDQPTSPNLDAWSENAVIFDHATAPAPWTLPSLGGLHTGRYPAEVGAYTNGDGIHTDFTTLAELFHDHGYTTASFNTHALLVGARGGFRQGFDTVYPEHVTPLIKGEHKMPFSDTEPALMQWLDAHAHESFFLWIHDMDPHLPRTPGNPYLVASGWKRYDAEVRWMDEAIGRVLAKLQALGLGDELLVIFTADHGEAFGIEHGLVGHQDDMYDEVLRVPLLVRYPLMGPPRRIEEPVALIDVYSTIAELAGLPLPEGTRSESLVPLLNGTRTQRQSTYTFHARYFFEDGHHWLAVRDHDWKLLARTPDLDPEAKKRGAPRWDLASPKTTYELYQLADDPGEQHDVADAHPKEVERLAHQLDDWGDTVAQGPTRAELDDATRETLRNLGY